MIGIKALLFLAFILVVSASPADEYVQGKQARRVVNLTNKNFRAAINDPANPVWLLKFYAYWCGHCKRLAPILDQAAPQVAGKMAIGKIDCTEEKKLCDEFKVRGYPTLKFSLDGEVYDYPLGRSEEEIVGFADRISRPTMKVLDTVEQAMLHTKDETYDHGVSFVCHDPKATGNTMEEMVESSPLLQVCAKVARKQKAHAHFSLLKGNSDVSTILSVYGKEAKAVAAEEEVVEEEEEEETEEEEEEDEEAAETETTADIPTTWTYPGFICRLEVNIAPRCLFEDDNEIKTADVQEYVKVNNVATVTQLGPHNFHHIGRIGRPLVIGVADIKKEEQVDKVKADLANYAINGPRQTVEKYFFGWMDGQRWAKFLKQFDIETDELPQMFILDVPERIYWQDKNFQYKSLEDFMDAVADGTIASKQSAGVRGARFLNRIAGAFFNWMPWSLLVLLGIATLVVLAVVPSAKELRPPYDKKDGAGTGGGSSSGAPVDSLLGTKKDN